MKLIINSDDFGLTHGVNLAVLKCHKEGILTSTTLMANTKYTQEAIQFAKETPTLGVGVHMVLTTSRPLLDNHKTLVDADGNFKFRYETIDETIDLEELYREWDAQIASIAKEIPITHLDSHHHVHTHPLLLPVTKRLAEKYNLPYRYLTSDLPHHVYCEGTFYKETVSYDYFYDLIKRTDFEVADVMTHPAYVDDYLHSISSYNTWREKELEILSDPKLKEFLINEGIELINYSDL